MKINKNFSVTFFYFSLIVILLCAFQWNIFHTTSEFQFRTYRDGSEALILGKIFADLQSAKIEKANLAFVEKGEGAAPSDVLSVYERVNHAGKIIPIDLTDRNWSHGFANFGPLFLLKRAAIAEIGYGKNEFFPGDRIRFSNGQIRVVMDVRDLGEYLHVEYSGERIILEGIKNREISIESEKFSFKAYPKQFGGQAIFFSRLYEWSPPFLKNVLWLQAVSAFVFSVMVVLVARELMLSIDKWLGIVFFLCMLGSPWIVSVARNLYWVPALWLLPVYVSFFSFRIIKLRGESAKFLFFYGLVFSLTIFIKSLCGYEYLSTIFIFSLLPFFLDAIAPEGLRVMRRPWLSCFIIFIAGVVGFSGALVSHAALRADGIFEGLFETIRSEAFKYNAIGSFVGAPSYGLDSSFFDLTRKYIFEWEGAVLFGLDGRWVFPVLLLGSALVVAKSLFQGGSARFRDLTLWLCSFIGSTSWSILMKDHSVIHTHLNFVLWYLFFIPVAMYLLVKFFISSATWDIIRILVLKIRVGDGLVVYERIKNNNFTLLRMLLAVMVLFGHSFPIVGGGSDPISIALLQPNEWVGSLAVHGFFFISGFLIVGSFVKRGALHYIISRMLRLYPAIFLYSLVTICVIGSLYSSVSLAEYFTARPWYNFINAALWEWNYNLPYVFEKNPIAGSTNGSLWTLPAELRCYILICVIGFFGALETRLRANIALILLLLACKYSYFDIPTFGGHAAYQLPLIYFITGAIFWINRNLIPMNWGLAGVCMLISLFIIKFGFLYPLLPACLGYLILVFVYKLPSVNVDRIGDLSYGIYIYAWPVQQLVWRPAQDAYVNFLLSLLLVVILAYSSWCLVEKPALDLRKVLVSQH